MMKNAVKRIVREIASKTKNLSFPESAKNRNSKYIGTICELFVKSELFRKKYSSGEILQQLPIGLSRCCKDVSSKLFWRKEAIPNNDIDHGYSLLKRTSKIRHKYVRYNRSSLY